MATVLGSGLSRGGSVGQLSAKQNLFAQLEGVSQTNLADIGQFRQLQQMLFKEGMTAVGKAKKKVGAGGRGFNRQAEILSLISGIGQSLSQLQVPQLQALSTAGQTGQGVLKAGTNFGIAKGFGGGFRL